MLQGSGQFGEGSESAGPHRYIEIIEAPQENMPFRWDFHDLADRLSQTLQDAEDAFRLEQAVYGLDSLDELKLHQLLVRGLSRWYTVQREVYYPSSWQVGGQAKKRHQRPRCDLVFSPHGRVLKTSDEPDLFTPADACPPEEALWLEIKAAYQYRDVATRHSGYAGQWKNGAIDDLKKMAADGRIHEAGLLLIVFNENEEVLANDLQMFEALLGTQGIMPDVRHVRSVRITERMGHRLATVALWSTIQRGES